jgi:16S rRNA (guanine966-N2)-methyltransferase
MRIIGGKFKSRIINSSFKSSECQRGRLSGYRPTSNRAKESLFDTLNNIIDFDSVICLDLFAGSGSIGFELLSRGAKSVDFVENNEIQIKNITKSAIELHCLENISIIKENAISYLKRNSNNYYDIIFADPPYRFENYDELLHNIFNLDFSIFILEHSGNINKISVADNYEVINKKIGKTYFTIFNKLTD